MEPVAAGGFGSLTCKCDTSDRGILSPCGLEVNDDLRKDQDEKGTKGREVQEQVMAAMKGLEAAAVRLGEIDQWTHESEELHKVWQISSQRTSSRTMTSTSRAGKKKDHPQHATALTA